MSYFAMKEPLLPGIDSPEDLKRLPDGDIPRLCEEVRAFLCERVQKMGGHLASNLGVVELTLAIHRVFSSPRDHILFDVGHQAYVHKMITGRREAFDTLRTPGGLSGFTCRRESEHDPFGAGHSSTSVSAALGFAEADHLSGSDAYTVCVIGDGAYTGGMVHEALNNCPPDRRLILILNENCMSISKNRGTFASYLARVRVSERYRRWKSRTKSVLHRIPLIGRGLEKMLTVAKEGVKHVVYRNNYFEDLGLYYMGPVDGNNFLQVQSALRKAKRTGSTVILHVKTCKGKGMESAERAPEKYHSVHIGDGTGETFHVRAVQEMIREAQQDRRVVGVTAAMGMGTGLDRFEKVFPDRYFDVGIAEEHALTFSAGLAAAGYRPYVAIYSTFLQRAYDNILHDVALQNLPVRMLIDRAGLAVADGATHHGIFDVAFLCQIPGITVYAPATLDSLSAAMRRAAQAAGPVAIRYPNGGESVRVRETFYPEGGFDRFGVRADFDAAAGVPQVVLVCFSTQAERTLAAADLLRADGMRTGVVLVETIKPYAPVAAALMPLLRGARVCVFCEEGIRSGGVSMILREALCGEKGMPNFATVAVQDTFAVPDTPCDLYDFTGLSPEHIARCAKRRLQDLGEGN